MSSPAPLPIPTSTNVEPLGGFGHLLIVPRHAPLADKLARLRKTDVTLAEVEKYCGKNSEGSDGRVTMTGFRCTEEFRFFINIACRRRRITTGQFIVALLLQTLSEDPPEPIASLASPAASPAASLVPEKEVEKIKKEKKEKKAKKEKKEIEKEK